MATIATIVLSTDPNPATVPADGTTTITCTATVTNDDATPAAVDSVINWTSTDTNVVFAAATSMTDASGIATMTITSSVAIPTADIVATSNDVSTVTATTSVTFTAVVSEYTVNSVSADPIVAAPGTSVVVSAALVDATGAPAPAGETVTWSADDMSILDVQTSDTDDSGIANVTVTSPASGVLAVTATVGTSSVPAVVRYYDASLPQPFVPNGMDNELDQYDLAEDVQVIINEYANAALGDIVIFHWDEIHSYTVEITDLETDFPISLNVTANFPPACLADGDYELFYEHTDIAGNIDVSTPLDVSVSGGNLPGTLTEPSFPEGTDGWINLNEANSDGGTPVNMMWNGLAVGDSVHLVWQGYDQSGIAISASLYEVDHLVTSEDFAAGSCSEIVPTDYIMPIVKGTAQAYYQLTPVSGESDQLSVAATINVDVQP